MVVRKRKEPEDKAEHVRAGRKGGEIEGRKEHKKVEKKETGAKVIHHHHHHHEKMSHAEAEKKVVKK